MTAVGPSLHDLRLTVHCGGPDCDCLGSPRCRALEPAAFAYVDGKPARFLPYDPDRGCIVEASDYEYDARPIAGFLATLTLEQRADALAYRGAESHGSTDGPRASDPVRDAIVHALSCSAGRTLTPDVQTELGAAILFGIQGPITDLIHAYRRLGGLLAEAEAALAKAEAKLTTEPTDAEVEASCEAGWEELRSLIKSDPAQAFEIGPWSAVPTNHAAKGRAETRAALAAFLAKRRG